MKKLRLLKKEMLFSPKQTLFNNCHCSTFVRADNGDYLVTYFAGEREGTPDNAIWLSRCTGGESWQTPVRVKYSGDMPHWNAVLFKDGHRIYLFYKKGPTVHQWRSYLSWSDDDGHTWTEGVMLFADDPTPRGPVRNKLIRGADGSWLSPGSVETDETWDCFIDKTFDRGKAWKKCPIPFDHSAGSTLDRDRLWGGLLKKELWENDLDKIRRWDGIIQPTLWRSGGSGVHAFMRSTRGRIYRSDSEDNGETWCEAYATAMPQNNSGIDVGLLSDGTLALVYNPVSGNWAPRTPIAIALSEDNGLTFGQPFLLETLDGELSYPSVNVDGELIRITFTYNRKTFFYCECVAE